MQNSDPGKNPSLLSRHRIVDEEKYHGSNSVYNRNAFIFNVCFVFDRDAELSVYEPVVRKTGRSLSALEEHASLLSSPPPGFSMANLLEQLYLDLNAYFETSIPLLGVDLDVGLFPFYMNPPQVRTWQVPVAVTNLEQMKTRSWDVTLYKVSFGLMVAGFVLCLKPGLRAASRSVALSTASITSSASPNSQRWTSTSLGNASSTSCEQKLSRKEGGCCPPRITVTGPD